MKRALACVVLLAAGAVMLTSCMVLGDKRLVPAAPKLALRVSAGATEAYTDKAGHAWQADKAYAAGGGFGFAGGQTVDRGAAMKIEGTDDARVYQTEHYSMEKFVAEVPNGKYAVRLHFAETYDGIKAAGGRVFDVTIQGKPVLTNFDVFKEAGAAQKAVVKEFKGVEVTGGKLELGFAAKTQNAEINGIEILSE